MSLENVPVKTFGMLEELPINSIRPKGWIRTFLERQESGLGGRPQMSGYPFDTGMFKQDISIPVGHFGEDWWPYEQTAYYLDGVLRAGYLLDSNELIDRGRSNIESVISTPGKDNVLGPEANSDWSRVVFFRAMMAEYDATGNGAIINAMSDHFLTQPKAFNKGRALLTIESLLWLYGKTSNDTFLSMAQKSFGLQSDTLEGGEYNDSADETSKTTSGLYEELTSDEVPDGHAVTWCENVKIPVLLYMYTGKKDYLDASIKGMKKLTNFHMLVDGCPSSVEHLSGNAVDAAHETCNVIDLSWSLGYLLQATGDVVWADMIERTIFNAGMGSLNKVFRAHQYYSSPNQAVCAEDTSHFNEEGWGRMTPQRFCYKPGHDTECCTGNIQRMMPAFAGRMWMTTPDYGLAATLYGPGEVTYKLGEKQQLVTVSASTNYPFEEQVSFTIATENAVAFPFLLRIPGWCDSAALTLNGEPVSAMLEPGTFFRLEREFKDGDHVSLCLPMNVRVSRWHDDQSGIALERGPLVYSLPVKARVVEYLDRGSRDIWEFPSRFLYPDGPWSYAICADEKNLSSTVAVVTSPTADYPWDTPPVSLRVPARLVHNWAIQGTRHTPVWPKTLELDETTETITLFPLGSTLLRMTIFPSCEPQ